MVQWITRIFIPWISFVILPKNGIREQESDKIACNVLGFFCFFLKIVEEMKQCPDVYFEAIAFLLSGLGK